MRIQIKTGQQNMWMLAPCVAALMVLTIFPLIYSIRLSFYEWHLLEGAQQAIFVGLGNFQKIFTDPIFWEIFGVTIRFSMLTVFFEFFLGLSLALLLDSDLKGAILLRFLIMVPMVVAPITIGAIWRLLFHLERGHVNFFLEFFGFLPRGWLSDPGLAFGTAVFVDIWKWSPLIALMLLAGLKSIPEEIYEAGRVDGAVGFSSFWHLTLPMLKPYIAVAVSIRLIDSFKTYDYLWILTNGGPGRVTELLNLYTYRAGMRHFHMGYASALAMILVIVAAFSGIIINRFLKRDAL
jgi:multiple sugar transport system permease protein